MARNLHAFLVIAAVVVIWRGIWGLMDTYFFPDQKILSFVGSILIGLIILKLIRFKLKKLE